MTESNVGAHERIERPRRTARKVIVVVVVVVLIVSVAATGIFARVMPQHSQVLGYFTPSVGPGPIAGTYQVASASASTVTSYSDCVDGARIWQVRLTKPVRVDAVRVCNFSGTSATMVKNVERTAQWAPAMDWLSQSLSVPDETTYVEHWCMIDQVTSPAILIESRGHWLWPVLPTGACGDIRPYLTTGLSDLLGVNPADSGVN